MTPFISFGTNTFSVCEINYWNEERKLSWVEKRARNFFRGVIIPNGNGNGSGDNSYSTINKHFLNWYEYTNFVCLEGYNKYEKLGNGLGKPLTPS